MRALGYAFSEALVSLRRSGRSAIMSMGTIAVAFLTLGGFLLTTANLQSVVERWASAAEMSVYLPDEHDAAFRAALLDELRAHRAVAAVEYVSKEQALERFTRDFPELADVTVTTEKNPFPPSLELRLHTDPESSGAADALAAELANRDGIVDVRYDQQWLARLLTVLTSIRVAGLAIASVLMLGAAFTITAVVRLSLHTRREELDIMELVGAPFSFIRGPAVAEGMLLAGIGATLSLVVLWMIFAAMQPQLAEAAAAWGSAEIRFLSIGESLLLIVGGLAIGGLAGMVASRTIR